jgi:addiction module HigA family antidote
MITLKGVESHMIANNLTPFYPVHPGGVVKEELESRNLKQKEFAQKIGLSYNMFNDILNERRPVSTEFALIMEAALGLPAHILTGLQTDYNLQIAQTDSKLTSRLAEVRKLASLF